MLTSVFEILKTRADFFMNLAVEHFIICTICIILATIFGGAIGIFISYKKVFAKPILAVIDFTYTIPSIAMLGFLIPVFGIGNKTAIAALTLYALLPMVRNTYSGLNNVPASLLEAAIAMGSSPSQLFWKVHFPLAFGVIFSGIRTMLIMTIALAGVASFIGAGGLGVAIYRGITTNNQEMVLAGSLLIAAMALFTNFLLGFFEKGMFKFKKLAIILMIPFVLIFIAYPSKEQFKIATKPMSEQYILANMMKILLEQEGVKTSVSSGIGGGTFNIHPAMLKGEFDAYVEYTGTAWSMVLDKKTGYQNANLQELKQLYQDNFNLTWINFLGFSNSYALAIRQDLAKKFNLKTISDLSKISNELNFGAEYDFFERDDGFKGLSQIYGLNFKSKTDLDIGLKYKAITQNQIDAMPIFTTDGLYSISNLQVLNDDKEFYPSYDAAIIINSKFIEKNPKIAKILSKFEGLLDNEQMAKLNYQVEVLGHEPKSVAMNFLEERGLLR